MHGYVASKGWRSNWPCCNCFIHIWLARIIFSSVFYCSSKRRALRRFSVPPWTAHHITSVTYCLGFILLICIHIRLYTRWEPVKRPSKNNILYVKNRSSVAGTYFVLIFSVFWSGYFCTLSCHCPYWAIQIPRTLDRTESKQSSWALYELYAVLIEAKSLCQSSVRSPVFHF